MHKSRIIELFKNAPDEIKSLTVAQLLERFQIEVDAEREEQSKLEATICDRFRGKYLKFRDENGPFDSLKVEYIFIEDIKPGSLTTEHKRSYDLSGKRVLFWNNHASYKDLEMGHVYDSKMGKELEEATIISKEEFDSAKEKYDEITEIIKNIKNDG